jgi:hypothetical protein
LNFSWLVYSILSIFSVNNYNNLSISKLFVTGVKFNL